VTRTIFENMGMAGYDARQRPCVSCGRPTTQCAITAFQKLPRPKRLAFEAMPYCALCRCDRVIGQLERIDPQGPALQLWTRYRRMLRARDEARAFADVGQPEPPRAA
jgi:hypothetical protein